MAELSLPMLYNQRNLTALLGHVFINRTTFITEQTTTDSWHSTRVRSIVTFVLMTARLEVKILQKPSNQKHESNRNAQSLSGWCHARNWKLKTPVNELYPEEKSHHFKMAPNNRKIPTNERNPSVFGQAIFSDMTSGNKFHYALRCPKPLGLINLRLCTLASVTRSCTDGAICIIRMQPSIVCALADTMPWTQTALT